MNEPLHIATTCPTCGGQLVAGSNGALCPEKKTTAMEIARALGDGTIIAALKMHRVR